jgi:hypothetical protein
MVDLRDAVFGVRCTYLQARSHDKDYLNRMTKVLKPRHTVIRPHWNRSCWSILNRNPVLGVPENFDHYFHLVISREDGLATPWLLDLPTVYSGSCPLAGSEVVGQRMIVVRMMEQGLVADS